MHQDQKHIECRMYNLMLVQQKVTMIDFRVATLEVSLHLHIHSLNIVYRRQRKPMIVVNPDGKSLGGEIGEYMNRHFYFARYGLK